MEFGLRLDNKSRMSREVHVRFREGLGVQVPRATRLLIILQGYPKAKAEEIRDRLKEFIGIHLGLELNAEKTLITHPSEEIRFLGYQLRSQGGRQKNLKLEIPKRAKEELMGKVNKLSRLHSMDEVDMLIKTSSIFRGWMEYYKYANAPQRTFSVSNHKIFWAIAHYLGKKHQTSMPQVLKKYGVTRTSHGRTRKTLGKQVQGKSFVLWCFPPKTGNIYNVKGNPWVDALPPEIQGWERGRSIEEQVKALEEANYQCQGCGTSVDLEVHHQRGLRGKTGRALTQSGKDKQKQVFCKVCHLRMGHDGSFAPRT